jgi:hypothetical protein
MAPARRDSDGMITVRPIISALAAVAVLTTAACGSEERPAKPAAPKPAPRFSSSQVSAFFEDVTGDPLQTDPSTSFDALTADRADYDRSSKMSERYGSFMIFVLRRPGSEAIYKSDNGTPVKPDANGIYWHDGGDTAMKPYKNVVLSWNADDQQTVDERFKRLDGVLAKLGQPADKVRAQLPPEDQPCGAQATGTCRDANGTTVTTVERGQRLKLPDMEVKVTKVETGRLVIPPRDYGLVRRAKGRFVLAALKIKNTGDEPLRDLYEVKLKIGEKVYDQSDEATWTVTPMDAFPLQPGDTTTAAVVFDLPLKAVSDALAGGVLAFPAGDDLSTVDDASQLGQIRLAGGQGAAVGPQSGTNS